jgi:hypothetical protein
MMTRWKLQYTLLLHPYYLVDAQVALQTGVEANFKYAKLSGISRRVVSLRQTEVSEVYTETSVYFNETIRRYIPEGC